jgi:hypothetical protein
MQEKTLLQVSVIIAVIGVIILFLISPKINFNKESLLNAEGGDSVILKGKVTEISNSEKFTKITITYQETADIIVFDNVSLNPNDIIEITGTKNNKKEIIAEKIKISYLNN